MKIAQALLLRKQLEAKVTQLTPLKQNGDDGLFSTKVKRVKVSDEIDEVAFDIPHLTLKDVTKQYDIYATALRKLDASIQKANWEFDVEFTDKQNPLE